MRLRTLVGADRAERQGDDPVTFAFGGQALPGSQVPETAVGERGSVEGQHVAGIGEDGPGPGLRVEAVHGGLHPVS